MIAELGQFALALGLCLSLLQVAFSFAGRRRWNSSLAGAGEGAAVAAAAAMAVAFAALIHAFVTSDFSVVNVAANSHTEKPLIYKIAGAWGSHEGSMLLWCLVLTAYGAAMALSRGLPFSLKAVAVGVQGCLGALFIAYLVIALQSSPTPCPAAGRGGSGSIRCCRTRRWRPIRRSSPRGMSASPVFSPALAALIEGRVDAAWARWVRPWTLAAWSLLTVGITLGSFWAYYELGWGGWWFWDPVENASLMPWLAGTALAALGGRDRKARRPCGLDRVSGDLYVHALDAGRLSGPLRGADLGSCLRARSQARGVLLLAGSWPRLRAVLFAARAARATIERPGCPSCADQSGKRVGGQQHHLSASVTTAPSWPWMLWPLLLEALGRQGGVGAPYFNLVVGVLMAVAFLVLPAGPLLAWKRGDALGAMQRLVVAALIALAVGLLVFALNSPRRAFAVL